jgi:hypothetical protein
MLFDIEADTGDEIVGYLVPDGYEEVPRLCLVAGGRALWSGAASEPRAALVAAGRHRTGLCGFRIGRGEVPDLREYPDAELRDLATGLTIYRRRRAARPRRNRVFRLETRLKPLRALDAAMEPHFQAWFPGVERYGAETVEQVLLLSGAATVYASGRVQLGSHAALMESEAAVLVQLRDPYAELAERIALFSGSLGPPARWLAPRERQTYAAAIEAFDGIDPQSPRALRRAFRRLGPEAADALCNPLARQLTAASPGEACPPNAVASALRALSGASLVVPSEPGGLFEAMAGAALGTRIASGLGAGEAPRIAEIAATLEGIGLAEAMLEADLEIYGSVSDVYDGIARAGTEGLAPSL